MTDNNGVALTTLTINAASPDVLGAVIKKITESVLAAVPPSAIEKIAAETLSNGKILLEKTRYHYGTDEKYYEISAEAGKHLAKLVHEEVQRQVRAFFDDDSVKKIVGEAVMQGMAEVLATLPEYAGKLARDRLSGIMMGRQDDPFEIANKTAVPVLMDQLRKTQEALVRKGVLNFGELSQ